MMVTWLAALVAEVKFGCLETLILVPARIMWTLVYCWILREEHFLVNTYKMQKFLNALQIKAL